MTLYPPKPVDRQKDLTETISTFFVDYIVAAFLFTSRFPFDINRVRTHQ